MREDIAAAHVITLLLVYKWRFMPKKCQASQVEKYNSTKVVVIIIIKITIKSSAVVYSGSLEAPVSLLFNDFYPKQTKLRLTASDTHFGI